MVVDALRRKTITVSTMIIKKLRLVEKLYNSNLELLVSSYHFSCNMLVVTNDLLHMIKAKNKK